MKLLVTVLVTVLLAACGGEPPPTPPQRFAIQVNAGGYAPSSIDVAAGQPIVLVFTRTTDEGCGQELAIPSLDIRRELPLNEPVEITLPAQEAGSIRFTCGMDMFDGAIVVQ